jgi:anhydro-N-acetylmuramic acid kinase
MTSCAAAEASRATRGARSRRRAQRRQRWCERFLAHPFFARLPPKSLDRDDFAELLDAVVHLPDADAAATLAACAAGGVVRAMEHLPGRPSRLLVTGGGRLNATLMARLGTAVGCPVEPVEAAGLDGDMLEAQAFAFLAARVLRGLPTSARGTTGVAVAVGGGTVSRPEGPAPPRRPGHVGHASTPLR